MTALEWDATDARLYQSGVRRGVFYPTDGGPGVPWNGLTAVDEKFVGGEAAEDFIDGVKFLDRVGGRNFQADVSAFSAPAEFMKYVGRTQVPGLPGVYLDKQIKRVFNFSYQTGVGEDGYKIHLVYNVMATASGQNNPTLSDTIGPTPLTWTFDATPTAAVYGQSPTAHIIIDSTLAAGYRLAIMEQYLYGTPSFSPSFPAIADVVSLFT